MKYRMLLFFLIFAMVFLGLRYAGQAMDVLPRRSFSGNVVETVVVGIFATLLFMLFTARRRRKSVEVE